MKYAALLIAFVLYFSMAVAQETDYLSQWQANKFSMFIHFGAYSELGGVWRGQNIAVGYSEQIQAHGHIFSDEYEKVTEHFNPSKWNADSIALLAKRAGMRSVVITSKHHDGFCMFKTATTNFNIVDGTPFKRDVLKELSDACRRHGLNFGLYFSIIDWHYPQAYPTSSHNADLITPEHHEFSKRQLRELLTNYGPISELWFDMGSQTYEQSAELRRLVKQLQPNCLISGRIGNDQGDFCVMGDNEYPNYPIATPWQVPASMYDETWGYRSWQKHVAEEVKANEKLLSLVKTVTRGGNYLLNIGPKGTGEVTDFEKGVLKRIGSWLDVNGEAIYGTQPLDLKHSAPGEMTTKDNKVYFHLLEQPAKNMIQITGILSKITRVYTLGLQKEALPFQQKGENIEVVLPGNFLSKEVIRVVVLEFDGNLKIQAPSGLTLKSNLTLTTDNATPRYSFSGVDYYGSYRSTVEYDWHIQASPNKKVTPTVTYTDEETDHDFILEIDGNKTPITLSGGKQISLKPTLTTWGPIYLLGELQGLFGRTHGNIERLDVNQPWEKHPWEKMTDWTNQKLYTKPADNFGNWYWYQTVQTPESTEVLVQVPTNDGVAVYLNGEERFTINNSSRDQLKMTNVVLSLVPGENQILVKYFNRFGRELRVGLITNGAQVAYELALPQLQFGSGNSHEVKFRLPTDKSIHQNVDAPNVKIRLK